MEGTGHRLPAACFPLPGKPLMDGQGRASCPRGIQQGSWVLGRHLPHNCQTPSPWASWSWLLRGLNLPWWGIWGFPGVCPSAQGSGDSTSQGGWPGKPPHPGALKLTREPGWGWQRTAEVLQGADRHGHAQCSWAPPGPGSLVTLGGQCPCRRQWLRVTPSSTPLLQRAPVEVTHTQANKSSAARKPGKERGDRPGGI